MIDIFSLNDSICYNELVISPFLKLKRKDIFYLLILLSFFAAYFFIIDKTFGAVTLSETIEGASVIDQLTDAITKRNNEIKRLQEEIEVLDKNIQKSASETKTLKNELASITNTVTQLNKQIKVTETKIESTSLNIQRLGLEIVGKEKDIDFDKESISGMIRIINEKGIESPLEIIFSDENFSDGWNEVDSLEQVQKNVILRIKSLEETKSNLIKNRDELDSQKKELVALKSRLLDQKSIANQNKNNKDKLLSDTKNQEANYQKILADRKKKMDGLARELFDYEAQLKVAIDPNSYPKKGTRVLSWPISSPYITQNFGRTADSGRLYASGTHNGIDFRAREGTPLLAAASGVVVGTGDTDKSCPNASYGKWILIKHSNGLATIYAHLSLIKVSTGTQVKTGDIIGYSGNTGYSTGPHLHFGVYVGNAVRIAGPKEYKSKTCGTYMVMPLAPTNAYLDPGAYLPLSGSNIKFD